jgi:exopolyphosphatase/guanosine-5'-triphosphate,3'-diphosphate pyrophosphatase
MSPASSRTKAKHARVVAIDVGSNAVRLMVADVSSGGAFKVVTDDRVPTQLGKGLAGTGLLNPQGITTSLEALARFAKAAKRTGIHAARIVATAAVREARNGRVFIERVRHETGFEIDLISGDEEGGLAYLSLARRFDVAEVPAASIDIGGGSAQVILSTHGVAARIVSMPLGAVRLTDQFGGWVAMATKGFPKLCRFIDDQLDAGLAATPIKPKILVGTGGAVTSVAALAQIHREEGSSRKKTDTAVDHRTLKAMVQAFRDAAPNLPPFAEGTPPDRTPILFAGLVVLERLADHFGVRVVHSHAGGLREGLCWSLADRVLAPMTDAMASVRELAARCRYEKKHAEHVATLAGGLLQALADQRAVREAMRHEPRAAEFLQAAAVLHDIGMVVGYAKHHKHSRDIILGADLQHVPRRDKLVLANIVRYHRRVGPRKTHAAFAALTPKDQHLVRVLAGVLRVADGLDRTHESLVANVGVTFKKASAIVTVTPTTPGDRLTREMRAARSKADLLAIELDRKIQFVATPITQRRG